MTLKELVSNLKDKGVLFEVAEDHVRWSAPHGVISEKLRKRIFRHRRTIAKILLGY